MDTYNAHADGKKVSSYAEVEESLDIDAKSRAFQALARKEGWYVAPGAEGAKYFVLGNQPLRPNGTFGNAVTIPVRVSDHSNVNRGYHLKEVAINLAPDDGYAFDDFESALWKLRNAGEDDVGGLTFGGEEAVYFSRKRAVEAKKALEKMEPVEVRGLSKTDNMAALRNEANEAYRKAAAQGAVFMKDGRKVLLTSVGLKKTRSHSADRRVLDLLSSIREVLGRAEPIASLPHDSSSPHEAVRAWHYYGTKVSLGGKELYAKLVVRESVNGEIYYDNDLSSIESIGGRGGDATLTKTEAAHATADRHTLADLLAEGNEKPKYARKKTEGSAWDAPPTFMERMIYDYQDKHIHLKKIIQSLGEVYESFNTYLQEELYHGRVAARVHKFVQRELNVLLKDMALKGITQDALEGFLWARHARERNAQIAKILRDRKSVV